MGKGRDEGRKNVREGKNDNGTDEIGGKDGEGRSGHEPNCITRTAHDWPADGHVTPVSLRLPTGN